jgi:hypothetical protein
MHKIHAKEFVIDDFSYEHLMCDDVNVSLADYPMGMNVDVSPIGSLKIVIDILNHYRNLYLKADADRAYNDCHGADPEKRENLLSLMKLYWWQMIQLLPSSYNQKRTVMLNYEVLAGIYKHRKNHKLDEWHDFCDWIEKLDHSELIIREKKIPEYLTKEFVMPDTCGGI